MFLPISAAYWAFKVDDAYISFVYAKNLVNGYGLTYNGLVVEGYSNFLWTVTIAPFIAAGWDPLLAARLLSMLLACGCLALTDKIMRQIIPGISTLKRVLALLTVALSAPFAAWTVGGLETILFTTLIALFVYAELQPPAGLKHASPLVVLAAALTRPEGAMLFPIMLAFRLLIQRQSWRQALAPAALFAIPFAAYISWRYLTYGHLLPNTAYLKLEPGLASGLLAAKWLLGYLVLRPLFAIAAGIGISRLLTTRQFWAAQWLLITMVVGAFCLFILYAGPDWMPHHRFVAPIVPLLGLYVAHSLNAFSRQRLRLATAGVAGAAIIMEVVMAISLYLPVSHQFGSFTDGLVAGAKWIRQNTAPGDKIAVVDAGALAYYSERRTIDIQGLNDLHIAHSPTKSDVAYVLAQEPKIIQLHVAFRPSGEILPPDTIDHSLDLFSHPDFQRYYEPYAAGATHPFFPFLFIRREAAST